MADRVQLLVGTRKGAFIYSSDERRERWELSEPLMPGWSVHHMAADLRADPPRLYAAANHWAWGPSVARSDDGGKTWEQRSPGLAFPQDMGISIQNVWNMRPGHESQPGVVFTGVQPAGLFRSEDWGESWALVDELNRHSYRKYWHPTGGGESSLHSIEIYPRDANRFYISISSGGSYSTQDRGETWELCSHRAIATTPEARKFIAETAAETPPSLPPSLPPGVDPAAADEMHKMRIDLKNPDRLWGQTHIGVFRSDDGGANWDDVERGLPSFHVIPIAVTRREPDAAYVVPLDFEDANFRVCPGQFTVYRTRDAGASWDALTDGLPRPDDYQSVYREGLDTDGLGPEGSTSGRATARSMRARTAATLGSVCPARCRWSCH